MRILIVEDDRALCRSITMVLKMREHEVVCADDMAQARAVITAFDPEVVILDLFLPDSKGPETMRAMIDLTDAPVVVFTADPTSGDEGMNLGALEFLVKGAFTAIDMPSAISRAVNRDRLAKALDRHESSDDDAETWPGKQASDPGKVGDKLILLAAEVRKYA